jgi:hypothetical protein
LFDAEYIGSLETIFEPKTVPYGYDVETDFEYDDSGDLIMLVLPTGRTSRTSVDVYALARILLEVLHGCTYVGSESVTWFLEGLRALPIREQMDGAAFARHIQHLIHHHSGTIAPVAILSKYVLCDAVVGLTQAALIEAMRRALGDDLDTDPGTRKWRTTVDTGRDDLEAVLEVMTVTSLMLGTEPTLSADHPWINRIDNLQRHSISTTLPRIHALWRVVIFGTDKEYICCLRTFVGGGTMELSAYLAERSSTTPLCIVEKKSLLERLVTAVAYTFWRENTAHYDLHPGNILVNPDGSVVFVDFLVGFDPLDLPVHEDYGYTPENFEDADGQTPQSPSDHSVVDVFALSRICIEIIGSDQTADLLQSFVTTCTEARSKGPHEQMDGDGFVEALLRYPAAHTRMRQPVFLPDVLPYSLLWRFLVPAEMVQLYSTSRDVYRGQTQHLTMPISCRFLFRALEAVSKPSTPYAYETLIISHLIVYVKTGMNTRTHSSAAYIEQLQRAIEDNRRFERIIVHHYTKRITTYHTPRYRRHGEPYGPIHIGTRDRDSNSWSMQRTEPGGV